MPEWGGMGGLWADLSPMDGHVRRCGYVSREYLPRESESREGSLGHLRFWPVSVCREAVLSRRRILRCPVGEMTKDKA